MTSVCQVGINWEPLDGDVLWLANGQFFSHTITVAEAWPVGTTSRIDIGGDLFVAGVLSADRLTFTYTAAPPAGDQVNVADRSEYEIWVVVPNGETSVDEPWKWFTGEVRRKD